MTALISFSAHPSGESGPRSECQYETLDSFNSTIRRIAPRSSIKYGNDRA